MAENMTEEQMIAALRAKGYAIRTRATGVYLLRYRGKNQWSSEKMETKIVLRRTRAPGPNTRDSIPKDAEIAEIDVGMLKWTKFWDAVK